MRRLQRILFHFEKDTIICSGETYLKTFDAKAPVIRHIACRVEISNVLVSLAGPYQLSFYEFKQQLRIVSHNGIDEQFGTFLFSPALNTDPMK